MRVQNSYWEPQDYPKGKQVPEDLQFSSVQITPKQTIVLSQHMTLRVIFFLVITDF